MAFIAERREGEASEILKEMREAPSPVAYLVGTLRGRSTTLEKEFLQSP